MLRQIVLTDVVDPHMHARGGAMAQLVVPHTSGYCTAMLAMPNQPRLNTVRKVLDNTTALNGIIRASGHECYVISCMMLDQIECPTTPKMIDGAIGGGIRSFKVYFVGTTTGAMGHNAAGINDFQALLPVFKRIEERYGTVHLHLELPAPYYFQWRERDAVPLLYWLVKQCPTLKIVVEHVSSARMVRAVMELPAHVTATLTSHHLYDTLDIVLGNYANVHGHCKPPHADPDNQTTLLMAAIVGLAKFRFGSDTASHDQSQKECAQGCAGCFTAPFALLMLAEIFTRLLPEELVQPRLQQFVSDSAVNFHNLKRSGKVVRLVRQPFIIPSMYSQEGATVVPYRAGHKLEWSIVP